MSLYSLISSVLSYVFTTIIYLFIFSIIVLIYKDIKKVSRSSDEDIFEDSDEEYYDEEDEEIESDEFVDEEILKDMVKYKIDNEGLWSVVNLLSNVSRYEGVYRIDVYGYGYDIDKEDLECLKEDILDRIGDEE